MRTLWRDKSVFYYTKYLSEAPVTDENGYKTGEYKTLYTHPVRAEGHISAANGKTVLEQFGNSEQYKRVIIMEDENCPIDGDTLLFIDVPPSCGRPDYRVDEVARYKHGVSYTIVRIE